MARYILHRPEVAMLPEATVTRAEIDGLRASISAIQNNLAAVKSTAAGLSSRTSALETRAATLERKDVYAIIPTDPVPKQDTTSLNVATAPITLPTRTAVPNGTYLVDVAAVVPITRSVPDGECWVVVTVNGVNGEETGIGYGGSTWSASSWFPLGARWHGEANVTDGVLTVGFRFAGKVTAGTTSIYKPIVSGIARRIR